MIPRIYQRFRQRSAELGLLFIASVILNGCASTPQAKLLNTRAEPAYANGRLTEVAFISEVATMNMVEEQLRYEVRVRDRKGRPVKSGDSQFRLKNGQVAASKTFMVNETGEPFGVRVTIPATQLELRNDLLPAYAEAELYYQNDQSLASATCPIPIARGDLEGPEEPVAKPKTQKKPAVTKKQPAPVKPPEAKKASTPKKETPPQPVEKPAPKSKPKPKPAMKPDTPSA